MSGALGPFIIDALGRVGAGVGSGLTSPTPYQPHVPYTGISNPQTTADEFGGTIQSLISGLMNKVSSPVSLPDATVQAPGTISSPDLPFNFSSGTTGPLATPPELAGIQFPPIPPPTSTGTGTPQPNEPGPNPLNPNPDVSPITPPGWRGTPTAGSGRTATNTSQAGPVRQQFTSSNMPSAMTPQSDTNDPRLAALMILQHAITSPNNGLGAAA